MPQGDSPPSSRLYLAVAAGCLPVIISDYFEGAFPSSVPWASFTLRFAESRLAAGRRRQTDGPPPPPFNLTAELLAVANDAPRLRAMQTSLQAHVADVLWEAEGSRVGAHALALATCAELGIRPIERSKIVADTNYVGDGYGIPTSQTIDAIRLFASTEGVLLDPVYSGKAGAGLIDYCARGVFKPGDRVCFLHTGGATSLHGYLDSFSS